MDLASLRAKVAALEAQLENQKKMNMRQWQQLGQNAEASRLFVDGY
jgi:hypothetical protein